MGRHGFFFFFWYSPCYLYTVLKTKVRFLYQQERKRSEMTAQNRQKERNKKEHFKNKKNGKRKNTLRTEIKKTLKERKLKEHFNTGIERTL